MCSQYFFNITAWDSGQDIDESNYSNTIAVWTLQNPGTSPTQLEEPVITNISQGRTWVMLNWSNVTDAAKIAAEDAKAALSSAKDSATVAGEDALAKAKDAAADVTEAAKSKAAEMGNKLGDALEGLAGKVKDASKE